jgi:hypothetical protein
MSKYESTGRVVTCPECGLDDALYLLVIGGDVVAWCTEGCEPESITAGLEVALKTLASKA